MQRAFYGADLMAGKRCNGLRRVRQIFMQQEHSVVLERHQVHLKQQIGIQNTVRHHFQNNHPLTGEEILLELHVVIFFVF